MTHRPRFCYYTTPYKHQKRAFDLSINEPYFALFMDPGTGKSKVVVDTAVHLLGQGAIDGVLVIAPKGMYHQWAGGDGEPGEWEKHASPLSRSRVVMYRWASGSSLQDQVERQAVLNPAHSAFVVMNIEALVTQEARRFAAAFLKSHRCLMVVDESSTIKNHKAARTRYVSQLGGLAYYRRILTGTPVTNSPLDVFSQMGFLHERILGKSYYAFRARYAELEMQYVGGGKYIKVVKGFQRLEELRGRIATVSFRAEKSKCLDLPPKIYLRRDVELGSEQRRAYQSVVANARAELETLEWVTAPMVLTKLQRLRQIVCGFAVVDDSVVGAPGGDDWSGIRPLNDSRRLPALMEALGEVPGKAIIWAHYRYNVDQISQSLKDTYGRGCVLTYTGDTKDRAGAQEAFQTDPKIRFFVATPQTGKFGLNLTAAATVVFYSNDFSLEVREQAEDRAHRIGQPSPVTYIDLVATETVDVKILNALRTKKTLAALITGDQWREWVI